MSSIRLVGPDDAAIHKELLTERLPNRDIDARLAWLYRGNPHGAAHCWIAFDDATGEAAGMTTLFPRKLWVDGAELAGALGGDMYVRPRHRRKGIARALFVAARADMERLGVKVMFGTPMRPNVTALLTSGSTVPNDAVVRYARVLSSGSKRLAWLPRPVGKLLVDPFLRPRSRRLRLDPVVGVDPRIDRLWLETRGELAIATVRDAEFYAWRFVDAPAKKQPAFVVLDGETAIAACALEALGERLRVVDLLAPRRNWRAAVRAIAGAAQGVDAQATTLELRLASGDATKRRLWTAGLLARERDPMSVLTPDGSPLAAALHDPSRWFLTWADTDFDHL